MSPSVFTPLVIFACCCTNPNGSAICGANAATPRSCASFETLALVDLRLLTLNTTSASDGTCSSTSAIAQVVHASSTTIEVAAAVKRVRLISSLLGAVVVCVCRRSLLLIRSISGLAYPSSLARNRQFAVAGRCGVRYLTQLAGRVKSAGGPSGARLSRTSPPPRAQSAARVFEAGYTLFQTSLDAIDRPPILAADRPCGARGPRRARAALRHRTAVDRRGEGLADQRDRPLQLPLRLLHARGRRALAAEGRHPHLRGDPRRRPRRRRGTRHPPLQAHRRRADDPAQHRGPRA